ncbi:MAG: hypothetical protein V1661_01160 [bacterium]
MKKEESFAPEKIKRSYEEKEFTPAKAQEILKDNLFEALNKSVPDHGFSRQGGTFDKKTRSYRQEGELKLQVTEDGNLKLHQEEKVMPFSSEELEKMGNWAGKGKATQEEFNSMAEQLFPEKKLKVSAREYTFDPEDGKKIFSDLSPEIQDGYMNGIEESLAIGEKIAEEYKKIAESDDVEEKDRKEARKNLNDELIEIEAKKKLIANLK